MKFTIALSVVSALVGLVSAAPAAEPAAEPASLEARGGHQWNYRTWCGWLNNNKGGWQNWSCSDNDYDHQHNCCKHEKKGYYSSWDSQWWFCDDSSKWDYTWKCPSDKVTRYHQCLQLTHYYGATSQGHQHYQSDCNNGWNNRYQSGNNWGADSGWRASQSKHHGGH